MTTVRAIVRSAAAPYNRRKVSVEPSASPSQRARRRERPGLSGRLLLRMSPALHGELARRAEEEGVSLNGYINACLAESVGWLESGEAAPSRIARTRTLTWLLVGNAVAVALAAAAAVAILLVVWLR
jgi:hypothetical protein